MRNTRGLRRGGPGRPRGVPNKATREARTFCQRLLEDPRYRKKFEAAFLARRLHRSLEAMVWAYAYGRPTQSVDLTARPHTLEELVLGKVDQEERSADD